MPAYRRHKNHNTIEKEKQPWVYLIRLTRSTVECNMILPSIGTSTNKCIHIDTFQCVLPGPLDCIWMISIVCVSVAHTMKNHLPHRTRCSVFVCSCVGIMIIHIYTFEMVCVFVHTPSCKLYGIIVVATGMVQLL